MEMNRELIEKAKETKTVEELSALAKENGIDLTGEEAKSCFARLHPENGALSDEELGVYANLLYDQSLLMAGLPLEDPAAFCEQVWKLM